jgi:hypothetical protein
MTTVASVLGSIEGFDPREIAELWRAFDTEQTGRLLRAHLIVEHFLNEHIAKRNPHLGDFRKAHLEFDQRLQLLDLEAGSMHRLKTGIKKLNWLRNKVAHDLSYRVTQQDLEPLYENAGFKRYVGGLHEPRDVSKLQPIDVVESFAQFAAMLLKIDITLISKLEELGQRGTYREEREYFAAGVKKLREDVHTVIEHYQGPIDLSDPPVPEKPWDG